MYYKRWYIVKIFKKKIFSLLCFYYNLANNQQELKPFTENIEVKQNEIKRRLQFENWIRYQSEFGNYIFI